MLHQILVLCCFSTPSPGGSHGTSMIPQWRTTKRWWLQSRLKRKKQTWGGCYCQCASYASPITQTHAFKMLLEDVSAWLISTTRYTDALQLVFSCLCSVTKSVMILSSTEESIQEIGLFLTGWEVYKCALQQTKLCRHWRKLWLIITEIGNSSLLPPPWKNHCKR